MSLFEGNKEAVVKLLTEETAVPVLSTLAILWQEQCFQVFQLAEFFLQVRLC